jgi:hypothetical protein
VIILDEIAHDRGRIRQNGRIKILACAKSPDDRFIDQENAVKDTVLAHQVFRRRGRFSLSFAFHVLAVAFMLSYGRLNEAGRYGRDETSRDGQAGSGAHEPAFRYVSHGNLIILDPLMADVAVYGSNGWLHAQFPGRCAEGISAKKMQSGLPRATLSPCFGEGRRSDLGYRVNNTFTGSR